MPDIMKDICLCKWIMDKVLWLNPLTLHRKMKLQKANYHFIFYSYMESAPNPPF